MSHATVLVTLDSDLDLESQVENAMSPFDENGDVFASGSRWDWWIIGGRWHNEHFPEDIIKVKDLESAGLIKDKFPAHFAFLHAGKWHEAARLGWFGGLAKTECTLAGNPEHHRCKAKSQIAPECYVVTWGDDDKTWDFKFYDRFIRPLPPETTLVTVDYRV